MEFDLRKHTVLLTVAGSRAYGMHTVQSDVDVKGVCSPPREYLYGPFKKFEQADKAAHMQVFEDLLSDELKAVVAREKLEGSVYDLRKFVGLSADCNPNILDALFCRDEEVLLQTPIGQKLRENRDLFLSMKAYYTFRGYARSQLSRIMTHRKWLLNPVEAKPSRTDFGLPDGVASTREYKECKSAVSRKLDQWDWNFGDIPLSERVRLKESMSAVVAEQVSADSEEWERAGRSLGMSDQLLARLRDERRYSDAVREWKQYQHWKATRNPARAAMEAESGYDRKHASHLLRLTRMGYEIVTTGKVNVWRDDAEQLLAVRQGAYTYEELMEIVDREDARLQEVKSKGVFAVPKKPDLKKIERLCCELVEESLRQ